MSSLGTTEIPSSEIQTQKHQILIKIISSAIHISDSQELATYIGPARICSPKACKTNIRRLICETSCYPRFSTRMHTFSLF